MQAGDRSQAATDWRREEAGYRAPTGQADDLQTARAQQMVRAQLVKVAGGDPRWWPVQTVGGELLQIGGGDARTGGRRHR